MVTRQAAAVAVIAGLFATTATVIAGAQEPGPPSHQDGFLAAAGRWFDEQFGKLGSGFQDAQKNVETFGREAGVAATTTAGGAKEAADAVARIPNTRTISGRETCRVAANGAPDCVAAADALCRNKGFGSGKSLDMTTAEVCPPKVYASGRSSGPECKTETFVSSALCQ
ncbi:hypothetical protein MXD81_02480 [Microbacteriaceae bacterium K1510]|nr:hypothetical protein [Microbacteriaceae bacterium K1510]